MASHPPTGLSHPDELEALDPVHVRGPAPAITRPRRPKPLTHRPAEVLTDQEVRALLAACGEGPVGVRHRSLLALMYRAGLRISEALSLRPHDVDLQAGTVWVRFAKGGRDRVVGLDPGAGAVVAAWAELRAVLAVPAGAPLFCTAPGNPITTAYVRRLLPVLGRRAGIAKRVHAHGLRHAHAAQLRSEGVDKAKRADTLSLHPQPAQELRDYRPEDRNPTHLVVSAVPDMIVMRRDLAMAGIDPGDRKTGFVDFLSLRMTLSTMLAVYGMSQRARQAQMRHSDPKLTEITYMDLTLLPIADELARVPAIPLAEDWPTTAAEAEEAPVGTTLAALPPGPASGQRGASGGDVEVVGDLRDGGLDQRRSA